MNCSLMLKIRLSLFLMLFSLAFHAQQIENVDFIVKDNFVTVTYNLVNSPSKTVYDIALKFIDGEGNETMPVSLSGDIKKIAPGKNKKIEWNTLNDITILKGNVKAIVEVSRSYSTRITGGPRCAFASVIVPGLGNYFVNGKQDAVSTYYIAGIFGTSVFYAWANKVNSDKLYNEYNTLKSQSENPGSMVTGYQLTSKKEEAGHAYNNFVASATVAASIWVADIIYVAIKGRNNKKKQFNYASNGPSTKLFISCSKNNYGIGLIKKF